MHHPQFRQHIFTKFYLPAVQMRQPEAKHCAFCIGSLYNVEREWVECACGPVPFFGEVRFEFALEFVDDGLAVSAGVVVSVEGICSGEDGVGG